MNCRSIMLEQIRKSQKITNMEYYYTPRFALTMIHYDVVLVIVETDRRALLLG